MLRRAIAVAVPVVAAAAALALTTGATSAEPAKATRAAVPPGAIKHIVVINLENEDFGDSFGPSSPWGSRVPLR